MKKFHKARFIMQQCYSFASSKISCYKSPLRGAFTLGTSFCGTRTPKAGQNKQKLGIRYKTQNCTFEQNTSIFIIDYLQHFRFHFSVTLSLPFQDFENQKPKDLE